MTEPATVNGVVQITTPGQLKWLATNTVSLSATIEQQNDLDLTNCGNWPGIGVPFNEFTGHYHGGGRTIIGLSYNDSSGRYKGLFGATLNATLSSVNVAGTVTGDQQVGGLVGQATGGLITLSSAAVTVTGNTASNKWSTGGLAGETIGTAIVDSSATGDVTGNSGVGGLVGYAENTAITNSHATGDVSGSEYLGGLVGYIYLSRSINNSHATGDVTGTGRGVGGLVGYNDDAITDSYATGDVSGGDHVGGLVGEHERGSIARTSATGDITGASRVGGLLGSGLRGSVTDSTVSATVTGTGDYVGGLVGLNYTTIVGAQATVTVTGTTYVGGLVGYSDVGSSYGYGNGSIDTSSASGTVTATGDYAGGIAGLHLGPIIDSHTTAHVAGASNVGGLTGYHRNFSGDGHITSSSAAGNVTATGDNVGGLIGYVRSNAGLHTTISASTATGGVTGREKVGGLIGFALVDVNQNGPITVSDVSASGHVTSTGSGSAGGLIGRASNYYTMSILDASATGDVTSAGDNAGGLIGWLYDERSGSVTTLERAYATGDVSAPLSYSVGGLIGYVYHFASGSRTTITQTHATGDVSGFENVGGLVGDLSTRNATLSSSFATGNAVAAQQYAGGLIGWVGRLSGALIGQDLYAQGNASGNRWNAALIGGLYNYTNVDLDNAYASGTATGTTEIGGAVAGQFTTPDTGAGHTWTVDQVFYATDSAYTRVDYGTAKTRAELDQFATYASAGWSITDGDSGNTVWGRCDGITYPFLMWQTLLPAGTPGRVVCPTPEVVLPPAIGQLVTQPVATSTSTSVPPSTTTSVPGTTPAPTDITPPPVLINGELPDLPAGDVVVLEDGQPVAVSVIVENETELVLRASTFELSLEGDCRTGGCTIDTTPEGRAVLTLEQDGSATTTGLGFQPGSRVDVWLFSEPRYLGQFTVNTDGTFQGNVQLGDIDPGEHTLQVNGTSQTGTQRSANLGVVVTPQQVPTPGGEVLPSTGTNSTPIWLIAMTLLALGLAATRRRRTV